jgi:hypothetical protein
MITQDMTDDKKKALQVYALGIGVVVICVGAALFHISYKNCLKSGGQWGNFSCIHSPDRLGKTTK